MNDSFNIPNTVWKHFKEFPIPGRGLCHMLSRIGSNKETSFVSCHDILESRGHLCSNDQKQSFSRCVSRS